MLENHTFVKGECKMKALVCERCGSQGIVFQDGLYVCQFCGTKYEPEHTGFTDRSTKHCVHCGEIIDKECIICPKCGKQVENLKVVQSFDNRFNSMNNNQSQPWSQYNYGQPNASYNQYAQRGEYHYGQPSIQPTTQGKPKEKNIALLLCIFLGYFGAHKFYEENTTMGLVYLLTGGLFCIGWIYDIFKLLSKPDVYYV